MSATVRPWVSSEHNPCDIIAEFKNSKGSYWATVATVEKGYTESGDNAALIVQAVNAHDALVEALEECIWVLEAIERGSLTARTLAREQLPKAKAALRQAGR